MFTIITHSRGICFPAGSIRAQKVTATRQGVTPYSTATPLILHISFASRRIPPQTAAKSATFPSHPVAFHR
jgi:hypothetical protein